MKSKVAILIAMAVIASVFAAGCTSSTQSSSNQSASQSTATGHDKLVQAVIQDDIQSYVNATWTRSVNETVRWQNDTTAIVTFTILTNTNGTFQYTAKYQKFDSAQQASDYVASINQGYNVTSTQALAGNDPTLVTASSINTHQYYATVENRTVTTNSYVKLLSDEQTAYRQSYIIQVNEVVVTFNATFNRVRA